MLELTLVTPEKNNDEIYAESIESPCDPTCDICMPCSPMS